MIRPSCLILTSNYRPEDIWPKKENPELLGALKRRFTIVRFLDDGKHIDWPKRSRFIN